MQRPAEKDGIVYERYFRRFTRTTKGIFFNLIDMIVDFDPKYEKYESNRR